MVINIYESTDVPQADGFTGWKNCVKLSTTVTEGGVGANPPEGPWGPERNAGEFRYKQEK